MSILIYARLAGVFRDAKDAPTSFEPEEWIEGFQDARSMIAERTALRFKDLPGFNEATFLLACDVAMSDEERVELEHKAPEPKVEWPIEDPAHVPGLNDALAPPEVIEGRGQFRAGEGVIITDWCSTREGALQEYERLVEALAEQKHNAKMLDGCETEDEFNAELRAQSQGDA